jgi:hypothetical protein
MMKKAKELRAGARGLRNVSANIQALTEPDSRQPSAMEIAAPIPLKLQDLPMLPGSPAGLH